MTTVDTTPTTAGTSQAPIHTKPKFTWIRKHLLTLEELDPVEIELILDTAAGFVEINQRKRKIVPVLKGKAVVNLFFEPSTRTKTSFSLAAKRLSADTVDFTTTSSSLSKGETFIDTAKNIEAMGIDIMVIRHADERGSASAEQACEVRRHQRRRRCSRTPDARACSMSSPSASARAGSKGLTVGLVGDIAHSRVARSNIQALTKLGAKVIVCGPPTLIPRDIRNSASRWSTISTSSCRGSMWSTCSASSSNGSATACSRRSANTPPSSA